MSKYLKIYLISFITVLLLTNCKTDNSNKEKIHKIRFTASSVELEKWNISDTTNCAYVIESVDNLGRTKELRFFNSRHQLNWAGSGFYGGPIIRYNYKKNKIVETFFSDDSAIAYDFKTSEVPYQHIYFLNEQNEIIDVKQNYKIDFNWTEKSFEETIKHLEFYKQYPDEGSELDSVFGFSYAYSKMNGINPKRQNENALNQ